VPLQHTLLLGINEMTGSCADQERLGLLVDIVKLRVAIDVLAAFRVLLFACRL